MRVRHREPRNGAKELLQRRFFRPVPGLVHWLLGPTAHAVGYVVSPSGLAALVAALSLCGAANPGCRPLSAGGCDFEGSRTARKSRPGGRSRLAAATFSWGPS